MVIYIVTAVRTLNLSKQLYHSRELCGVNCYCNRLLHPQNITTRNTGTRSIIDQEYDYIFTYSGETYSDVPSICNFNHILHCLLLSSTYNPCEFVPPHSRGTEITHKDAPQSVGLLWTSDQPVAETYFTLSYIF